MKQLDLGKQRKTVATAAEQSTERKTQIFAKPAATSLATRQTVHKQQPERKDAKDHPAESSAAPRDDLAMQVDPASHREEHRAAEKEPTKVADVPTSAPITNDRNKNPPEQEGIVSRATLPFPVHGVVDESSSYVSPRDTVSESSDDVYANLVSVSQQLHDSSPTETSSLRQSISHGSVTDDPRFYVCTSFARTSSQKTMVTYHSQTFDFESNVEISSLPASQLQSLRSPCPSPKSFPYYDYCLSELDFDITPPLRLTQTTEVARKTARAKEAEIFRRIEGDDFDENAFFSTQTQVSLWIDFANDDDVTMLPA